MMREKAAAKTVAPEAVMLTCLTIQV